MQQEGVTICNSRYAQRIGSERFFISSSFGFCAATLYGLVN